MAVKKNPRAQSIDAKYVIPYPEFQFFCSRCGKHYNNPIGHFYKNQYSDRYTYTSGYTTICVDCVRELFEEYTRRYNDERFAAMLVCAHIDVVFLNSVFESVISKNGRFDIGVYVRIASGMQQYSKKTFSTSLANNEISKKEEEYRQEAESEWDETAVSNRNDVCEVFGGVDPFSGYPVDDRKFLFNEIINYLDDDSVSDPYKLSVLKQLCVNTLQISKYDLLISGLNPLKDSDQIATMQALKSTLVSANDKLTKENEISIKNRSNKQAGRDTIGGLLRDMRDKDIDGSAVNFYDMLQSQGTRWATEMSMRAMRENCMFDDNDTHEIISNQREMIQKLQKQVDDLSEKNRILMVGGSE